MLDVNPSGCFPYTPATNLPYGLAEAIGRGLGKLEDKVFRIGRLGDMNDPTLCGVLAGMEMGLSAAGVPHEKGGTRAAMEFLAATGKSHVPG